MPLLYRSVDTIQRQLIFILSFSLLHVKLRVLMTSSCWPHSGLESPFKFPAELLLKSNCIQANNSAWCDQRFNRQEPSTHKGQCGPSKPKHIKYILNQNQNITFYQTLPFSVLLHNIYINKTACSLIFRVLTEV